MSENARIIEVTEQFGAHNYHPLPVVIARGEGIWVEDADGKRYMDMLSAYSAINHGHCHPAIIRALVEQAQRLTLTSRAFHNDQLGPFLRELCEFCGMDMALPMNTGAEAVETAIKAVRMWGYKIMNIPGAAEIVVCNGNFHGRTTTIVSFSDDEEDERRFGPHTPGFVKIPYNDTDALEAAIGPNTVAFLVEPIQGEAGVKVPDAGYLAKVREICTRRGILLVFDEIQTGFGRCGKRFAHQYEDAKPDVLLVGKALGGGVLPVSAALASRDIMGVFRPGDHGSTFGGNPLAAAVGRESLRVLEKDDLVDRSRSLGKYFRGLLTNMKSPLVHEVRGKGLLIGVQLVDEAGGARQYCERLMERGVLCKETHENVIRFAPPLIISMDDIDKAMEHVRAVLTV